MKTTILVGAGATLAEALAGRPPRNRLPPLDSTFFDLCRLARLDGRTAVRSYMVERYGIDPFATSPRMEEIFNFIYSDAFPGTPPAGCLDAYWGLHRMYREAIAKTTNGLNGTSYYGVGALLRFLIRDDPERDINFITFNQDLLIEKSIEAAAATKRYGNIPWNLRNTYGIAFDTYRTYTDRSSPFKAGTPGLRSIPILKLHGSLNWVYSVRSGADPKNSLRTPSRNLHCLNERVLRIGRTTIGPSPGSRTRTNALISLIVPPIYEKAARYQATLSPIWEKARNHVEETGELIVFGYSFSPADVAARSMLRRAYVKNSSLQDVHVIDIDATAPSRISEVLGARCTYHYRSIPDFVEHYH